MEMLAPAPLRCPISLDAPPLCAQITPCGHVFAFPAIMAHLAAHNNGAAARRAAPCPLCYAPVVARELRLVRVHLVAAPQARPDTPTLENGAGSYAAISHLAIKNSGTLPALFCPPRCATGVPDHPESPCPHSIRIPCIGSSGGDSWLGIESFKQP